MEQSPLCPHCGYSLAGCKPQGGAVMCPECGERFSFDTSTLRLPFLPLLAAVVGLQSLLLFAILAFTLQAPIAAALVPADVLTVIASPAAFATIWSRRWQEPWRTAVLIRYLVAGYALSIVTFGVSILAARVISHFV